MIRYVHICIRRKGFIIYDTILFCMSTSPSDSTLYKCEICNKTFSSQQEIEQHNKEKHIETTGQKE
jgi:hypothetical protein